MQKFNVSLVYDPTETHILMCLRSKEPFKGLYNLVGGRVEPGERNLAAAYRELQEETGITRRDITLKRFLDFRYHAIDIEVQVFVGKLRRKAKLTDEVNKLHWVNVNENFFDVTKFAGHGNIGHIIAEFLAHKDKFF